MNGSANSSAQLLLDNVSCKTRGTYIAYFCVHSLASLLYLEEKSREVTPSFIMVTSFQCAEEKITDIGEMLLLLIKYLRWMNE